MSVTPEGGFVHSWWHHVTHCFTVVKWCLFFFLCLAPPLTIESILTAVQGVAWKGLGKMLFWNNPSYVNEIEAQEQSDDERLHALIDHWLEGEGNEQPSWRALIYNLDHAEETELADKIRQFAEPVSGESCDTIILLNSISQSSTSCWYLISWFHSYYIVYVSTQDL